MQVSCPGKICVQSYGGANLRPAKQSFWCRGLYKFARCTHRRIDQESRVRLINEVESERSSAWKLVLSHAESLVGLPAVCKFTHDRPHKCAWCARVLVGKPVGLRSIKDAESENQSLLQTGPSAPVRCARLVSREHLRAQLCVRQV